MEEDDYYDKKQAKSLAFFEFELKYLAFAIWLVLGYNCYVTNHFVIYLVISGIVFSMVFLNKIGKFGKIFKKCFNRKNSDIQK